MPSFDVVRAITATFPEVEEATSYGTPAVKVRGKLFARLWEDGATLVLKVDPLERQALIEEQPEVFFVTAHYQDYPAVLVHLPLVDRDELAELLTEAWRMMAPKRLVAAFDAKR